MKMKKKQKGWIEIAGTLNDHITWNGNECVTRPGLSRAAIGMLGGKCEEMENSAIKIRLITEGPFAFGNFNKTWSQLGAGHWKLSHSVGFSGDDNNPFPSHQAFAIYHIELMPHPRSFPKDVRSKCKMYDYETNKTLCKVQSQAQPIWRKRHLFFDSISIARSHLNSTGLNYLRIWEYGFRISSLKWEWFV